MIFDLRKEFDKILKLISGEVKYRLSDAALQGTVMNEQPIEIEVDWIISGDIDTSIKDKKAFPIGEDNQTKIIKKVRIFKIEDFEIELKGVGKKKVIDGIKHIFKYQVNLSNAPMKNLTEIIMPKLEEKKPIKMNKLREVKYGKNSIDSK